MSDRNTKTVKRSVTILARYRINKDGIYQGKLYKAGWVVLVVENDKGARYTVTLRGNGDSCSCKATKVCYHINHCREVETAREQRTARQLATLTTQLKTPVVAPAPAMDLAARGVLNGQQGFSFYR